jgi:ATP-dependent Clp protease protease subunit
MEKDIKKSVVYYASDEQFQTLLSERKILINDNIDGWVIDDIVANILKWNKEDKGIPKEERKKIIVYINTYGGSVSDGFSIIDTILLSKTPVVTVNIGCEYSMGFLIGLAGHERLTLPSATFLLHDGSTGVINSMSKVSDTAKFYKQMEEQIKDYVLAHSSLSSKMYNSKYGNEWYMYPTEALKYNFVDRVVTDIDEIL